MDLSNLTISRAIELLKSGEISSVDLCNYYLERIEKLNPDYNVFLFLRGKDAILEEAKNADLERKNSSKKLLGIPFTLKDSYNSEDTSTTAGDSYLKESMSAYEATIVKRLKAEGAILLGKVNMDSWGFGSSTENSAYGVTKNPFHLQRVAGGSSGGSAASVALDLCIFSIGEDTGGSIRQPSSHCGVFGLKPTYGRVPRFGCIAYASSLDTVGPIARSAEDLEMVFEIIKGADGNDMTTVDVDVNPHQNIKKKFAFSPDFIPNDIDESVRQAYLNTIEKLKESGYQAVEVSFPFLKYCIPTYYITAMSEASTNLARYTGTRYGFMSQNIDKYKSEIKTWEDLFIKSRSEGFGAEAKRRSVLGAYVLSEGYYDAYYKKAQKVRNLILEEINKILDDVDFILSPVAPTPAPKIGENTDNPVQEYLGDIYTVTANLAGIPSVAFPVGRSKDNLPVGLQMMAGKFEDEKILKILKELGDDI